MHISKTTMIAMRKKSRLCTTSGLDFIIMLLLISEGSILIRRPQANSGSYTIEYRVDHRQQCKQQRPTSHNCCAILLAEAKGVAGMGKAGQGVEGGQGGTDKAGQRVPRETYLALSYACTWILFTLSVPVLFYGLNKMLGKVKVCCGCKKKASHPKQTERKHKQKQQSTQSLIGTISGQISQSKSDSAGNASSNSVCEQQGKRTTQSQFQNHQYLNQYFSNAGGADINGNTNESFRSKVKAPKLKQLEQQATIGKYNLQQQQQQLEMLQNSLMSTNLALYHQQHQQQQQQQQQMQQQQSALSNSQQDFDKRSDTRPDKRNNNCYNFQQLNGYNLPPLKSNYNFHNNFYYTNLHNNNSNGLSNVVKSAPSVEQSHLLQQQQQHPHQNKNKIIKIQPKKSKQCPNSNNNLLVMDNSHNTTTSSSNSSKSNNGAESKKGSPSDSFYSSKPPPVTQQPPYNEHLDRLTFGPMNHSQSMNLTDLNSYNSTSTDAQPNINSDFLIGAKTLSHYPDLKVDSNFGYSLVMRDNMAR